MSTFPFALAHFTWFSFHLFHSGFFFFFYSHVEVFQFPSFSDWIFSVDFTPFIDFPLWFCFRKSISYPWFAICRYFLLLFWGFYRVGVAFWARNSCVHSRVSLGCAFLGGKMDQFYFMIVLGVLVFLIFRS